MKKIIVYLLVIYTTLPVSRYELTNLLDNTVYFPKSNSAYIEELLNNEKDESLLELALFYSKLGHREAAVAYLQSYRGSNLLKKSKVYNSLEDYKREIELIELSLSGTKAEHRDYYNYIISLAEEKNLELDYKYSSFPLFYLTKLLHNPREFQREFEFYQWPEKEIEYILELLEDVDLRNINEFSKIYSQIASPSRQLMRAYEDIYSVEDNEGYNRYFYLQEKFGINIGVRSQLELLQKYRYSQQEAEYRALYKELLEEYLLNNDNNKLMSLYLISGDYRLAYNLAFTSENLHFKFIENMLENNRDYESITRALADFEKKYIDTSYDKEIKAIKIAIERDVDRKIQFSSDYLMQYYSEDIARNYLRLILETHGRNRLLTEVERLIYSRGMEKDFILNVYISLIRNQEDYLNKLRLLANKELYFQELSKNNIEPARYLEEAYIRYLFSNKDYDRLERYKDRLSSEQYKELIDAGYAIYKVEASRRYELDWIDRDNIKYFYLNKDYVYEGSIVEELLRKERRNAAEDYYLMRYYYQEGYKVEGDAVLERLSRRYNFDVSHKR